MKNFPWTPVKPKIREIGYSSESSKLSHFPYIEMYCRGLAANPSNRTLKMFTMSNLSNYPARACAARGKVIEFVCLSVFLLQKIFEIAWTSHFQDFWAYQKVWKRPYLTCLYLPLGWLAPTLWDFCCFLIIRSTLSAILFTATSHAHKLYATCTLTFMPMPAPSN